MSTTRASSGIGLIAAAGVAVALLALHGANPGGGARAARASLVGGSLPGPALAADAVWAPRARRAPAFALRDQSNHLVSLAGRRGRVVLLTFMDSRCKFVCTLQGPAIARVIRRVRARRRPTLLVVSVNPWEDTAASSLRAGARYGFAGDWHWLRGSVAQLRPIWRAYRIEVARARGDVNHSTAIYLIDPHGYERAGFNYPFPPSQVVRDAGALAAARAG